MQIELDGPRIVVTAPAKVNLFLEVVAKLPSGYHEIDTLMCPISLCDKLIFEEKEDSAIRFQVKTPTNRSHLSDPAWEIPVDQTNLVVRAVERVRKRFHIEAGCEVTLEKNIPACAGLGGGSSDAAAAIFASMVKWGEWNRPVAQEIGSELGSDVNFFLGDDQFGIGLARCTGRGEMASLLPWHPQLFFTVSHPPVGCSTRDVYARSRIAPCPRTSDPMVKACQGASMDLIGIELFNALQEPATQITKSITQQIEYFQRIGARFCSMTGSGSACFALARSQRDAEEMACHMRSFGLARAWAVKSWYARPVEQQLKGLLAAKVLPDPA